ncbi:lamin tail domain-containing protein, partial [Candidatus Berkelbacteria bacterium]|nr:lamin tail domain-containing protein [Candidatus Berkelbacteria bacterium]
MYNRGNAAVDLDGWSIQDSSSTVYGISEEDFALTTVSPGGYFVIPRERSSIALNNTGGDAVKLYWPNGELVDAAFYGGSAAEEQSWSRFDSGWQWATPTRGVENQPLAQSDETDNPDEETGSTFLVPVTAALPPEGSLFLTELLPNPDGRDDHEWIELHASSTEPIDLTGWSLDDGDGGSKPYRIPVGTAVAPGAYVVFNKEATGLSLNNALDSARLIDPNGRIWDQVSYEKAPSGNSYAYDALQDEWSWVSQQTPGGANVFEKAPDVSDPEVAVALSVSDGTATGLVAAKGIVLMPAGILAKRSMYIASEETGDLQTTEVYNYHSEFPKLHAGDRIEAVGTVSEQNGSIRLSITDEASIIILDTNRLIVSTESDIAGLNEDMSRSWVTIAGTVSRVS